jgi:hypothetical protein
MRHFHFAGRSSVHALNGMVATSHPQAALAAIDVLRAGGTAADAAVAAAALLAVIEPQSTGIGGDGFGLYQRGGEGPIVAYNGSGRAPKAAEASWFLDKGINAIPLTSAHSVTVPGVVDLWATILRDHGKFGLDRLMQPAIAAGTPGRREWLRRGPPHRLRLGQRFRETEEGHQRATLFAAGRQGARRRRRDPSEGTRQGAACDRRQGTVGVLHR